MRQRLSVLVIESDIGEVLPASSVHGVGEPWVVRIQLGSVREDLVCEAIQVADTARKPWHSSWINIYSNQFNSKYAFHEENKI